MFYRCALIVGSLRSAIAAPVAPHCKIRAGVLVLGVVAFALGAPGASAAAASQLPEFNLLGVDGSLSGNYTQITSMDMTTGALSGTANVDGEEFTVVGTESGNYDRYVYTLTGSSYISTDYTTWGILPDGNIGGPGGFDDSNGTSETYTTELNDPDATVNSATAVVCPVAPASSGDAATTYTCTATVTGEGGTPTGNITWDDGSIGGTFSAPACQIVSGACSVTYTPPTAGAAFTINATYSADATYKVSQGTATFPAVTLLATPPATVDTYLDGSADATFKLTLSRASNAPVTVDYATQDGTGTDAAKAAEGDYKPVNGTLTFAPGTTTATIKVQCNADIKLRDTSDFDLALSNLSGASFASTTSTAALERERVPSSTPAGTFTVQANIDPNLLVGTVIELKDFSGGAHITVYLKRYNTHKFIKLRLGDSIYVGDEIYTGKTTGAALEFLLGSKVGINPGTHVKVTSERSIQTIDGTLHEILKHKIGIWADVERREGPYRVQIQTNGGVLGDKG
jgi:hypothetical protein